MIFFSIYRTIMLKSFVKLKTLHAFIHIECDDGITIQ